LFNSTTILAVKKDNLIAMAGDGQVTFNNMIMKTTANKVRRIFNNNVLVGFAGASADAITLMDMFESKLEKYDGNLLRAAVELTKEWRTDKILRRLEAMMIVAGKDGMYTISGSGDIVAPDGDVIAIGSGAMAAFACATGLLKHSNLKASEIAIESLKIAASLCIYTNENIVMELIEL